VIGSTRKRKILPPRINGGREIFYWAILNFGWPLSVAKVAVWITGPIMPLIRLRSVAQRVGTTMFFAQDQLEELNHGHREIHGKLADLREKYLFRNATHGFGRRLGTLVRCIDRVFEILTPDREEIPSRDAVI
jgi:hypothetical protein